MLPTLRPPLVQLVALALFVLLAGVSPFVPVAALSLLGWGAVALLAALTLRGWRIRRAVLRGQFR